MNFDLNDEHKLVEQSTREWGAREVAPRIQQLDHDHTFDRGLLPKMAGLGLLGVCVPAKSARCSAALITSRLPSTPAAPASTLVSRAARPSSSRRFRLQAPDFRLLAWPKAQSPKPKARTLIPAVLD